MTEPKTFIAALEEIEQLKARNSKLESDIQDMIQKAASKHRPAYDEQQTKIMRLEGRIAELEKLLPKWTTIAYNRLNQIAELKAVVERLAGDYFTTQIEGEEEWQFLDRELTATKQFAADALERIKI